MLRREARIRWVRDGRAGLCLGDIKACVGCAGGCALYSFGRAFRPKADDWVVSLAPDQAFLPGDPVSVELPAAGFLRAVMLGIGLPLLGLLTGGVVAGWFIPGAGDAATLAGALAGLALAGTAAWQLAGRRPGVQLRIVGSSGS